MAKDGGTHPWFRLSAGAETGGRIQPGYLATERRRKTADQFASEFECAFVSQDRQVFAEEWLERSFSEDTPVFDDCSRADLRYMTHRPTYYLGIDYGKERDHAALVLMEYRVIPTGQRDRVTYGYLYRRELRVVAIERFRLKTDYHDVAARVARLCSHPHLVGHTTVIYEMNGPGQVVHELLQRAKLEVTLLPVTTTGGQVATVKGARRTVPKAKLVASLEILFQQQYLKIASALPQADLLREELRQFEGRSRRGGSMDYGAGAGHDDLVMALALAGWWAYENRARALSGPEVKLLD